MKRFKFRLQTVLKLRAQREEKHKRRVGELTQAIQQQQQEALLMAEMIKQQGQILREKLQGRVDTRWIGDYQRFVSGMQGAIGQRVQAVSRIQPELNAARRDLAEAARQTKIMEKLKEKQADKYQHQIRKAEAKELDEVANQIFLRTLRGT